MKEMCGCIDDVNRKLAEHNTRLGLTFVFAQDMPAFPTIATEQIERGRGKKKAVSMLPRYCPFCGAHYPNREPTP